MNIELRQLCVDDGEDIFEMLREIGPGEHGFSNSGFDVDYADWPAYLKRLDDMSKGIGIDLSRLVPQTIYWLCDAGRPVGLGKLRDYLNDRLRIEGGHIGYCIRPTERGKGYGTRILAELLKKAAEKGIDPALLTCSDTNPRSIRVIERNGGVLEDVVDGRRRYWVVTHRWKQAG